MISSLTPEIATLLILCTASILGIYPIKKLIDVKEARHELRHGSPGFLRTISGWTIIVVWLVTTWFLATITGDWWATGDLEGALQRSGRRLELVLRILAALSND
ncbi:MAG: hypothetical protein AAGH74_06525 [Pseudomonadota bacterium]